MLHSRHNCPLSILPGADDCIPFLGRGNNLLARLPSQASNWPVGLQPHKGKGSQAAKPQHISLLFQAESALFCMAQVAQLWPQPLLSFSEGARKEKSKASTKWHLITFSGKQEQRSYGVTSFMMWLWECHYKCKYSFCISFSALTQRSLFQSLMR